MATENLALWIAIFALSVFMACFVAFVWDQRRVDTGPPPISRTTIDLPESPLNPILLDLYQRFDLRLTSFESETEARLNKADSTELWIRQIRGRIEFLQIYSNDIDNPVAERTQAVAQAEVLTALLIFTEGQLQGLRYRLRDPTL